MKMVFLDRQTFSADIDLTAIKKLCTSLSCYAMTLPAQVVERCREAEVVISNKVALPADALQQLPDLKLICIAATGTNNVDLAAAKALSIAVVNVQGYARHTLSQYVFAHILAYYSKIQQHYLTTASGLWPQSTTFCVLGEPMYQLANKSLGLIGYGALAQAVEKIALAFDMQVLVAERPGVTEVRSGRMPFNQVLARADIVSLHCPQTPQTTCLINAETLSLMKPSAMLINTARGALIDNQALLEALQQGTIAYAVLDVLEQEPPPPEHILLNSGLENLKITAHIAWACQEAQQDLINRIADNLNSFRQGGRLNRVV